MLQNKSVILTGKRLSLLYPANTEPHPPSPRQCNSSYLASNAAVTKNNKNSFLKWRTTLCFYHEYNSTCTMNCVVVSNMNDDWPLWAFIKSCLAFWRLETLLCLGLLLSPSPLYFLFLQFPFKSVSREGFSLKTAKQSPQFLNKHVNIHVFRNYRK